MTHKVKPTVEGWERTILESYVKMCIKGVHRKNGAVILQTVPTWIHTVVIPLLSNSVQEAKAGEAKKTAMDIIHLLDDLEVKQPEDLKTDNWRNWKYIRDSIVDKYGILTQLRTESTLTTKEES